MRDVIPETMTRCIEFHDKKVARCRSETFRQTCYQITSILGLQHSMGFVLPLITKRIGPSLLAVHIGFDNVEISSAMTDTIDVTDKDVAAIGCLANCLPVGIHHVAVPSKR